MSNKALITDIQRFSVHDGPGLRTTVFFKGCPLNCVWCYNPECISYEKEIMHYPEKCIGCGMCEKGCYSGAKVVCGKEMTAAEIFDEIMLDKPYYGVDGGVTFSGGEALSFPEILKELIVLCKNEGINVAIETSLYIFNEDILKSVDCIMADFKLWDDKAHKKYTGVSNEKIKENFEKLDKLGVPFIVRTPLIPGITDNASNISCIRDFIKQFKNIVNYELLPYNPLGTSKAKALDKDVVAFEDKEKSVEELKMYADL